MSEPVLDPLALARLRRIGGERLLRAMTGSFLENGAARIAAARAALESGDADALSDAAHALKSSAGNVGATTLLHVAQKVEREAKTADAATLRALVHELATAYDDASVAAATARDAAGDG